MDDLIVEFLTETQENLGELDLDLVELEQNPNDKELLGKIFRVIHTVKGTCGFLGLPRLEGVAHKGEDVLGLFRDGVLEVTTEYVTLIFECLDRIKFIVGQIEETGSEPEGDDSELIDKLVSVYKSAGGEDMEDLSHLFEDKRELSQSDDAATAESSENESMTMTDETVATDESPAEDIPAAAEPAAVGPVADAPKKSKPMTAQTLRVNVDVLENLMTMVSELVLTRNQLLQISRTQEDSDFGAPLQRLNHVVSELQEGVMQTRMQPIGNAWSKLPRIIRDLSMELNKKLKLDMKGEDTELDRQVLEMIKDPLTHMVRNSGDHGVETPEERVAAGKPETGTILLNAYHEGGHIIIEIEDDGKGLAVDKIREKIIKNGLATEDELADMSDNQVQQFIFKAGFSTAEQVTAVSGRGVGMDVVRTNIEKIGGSIELTSVEGKGTKFTIKIPLTLAIVSALIVEAGKEKFAIPQIAVKELVRTSITGENRIETIKGTPVFRLRNHLLPLVSLNDLLGFEHHVDAANERLTAALSASKQMAEKAENEANSDESDQSDGILSSKDEDHDSAAEKARIKKQAEKDEAAAIYLNKYIVVTQVGQYNFGIIVDRVFDTEEIVVKPVSKILKGIEIFSGNTILGDGTVIMILDPSGIAKSTGDIETGKKSSTESERDLAEERANKVSLLLFNAGDKAPKAVPLELVSRLEEIDLEKVERTNDSMVVQYRGKLMQLIPYDNKVEIGETGRKPVLVFSDKDNAMGIIVDHILDIVEDRIEVQLSGQKAGLLGSAIIDGKATDVVDVGHFINLVDNKWFNEDSPFDETNTANQQNGLKRVLLVEDSPFFRNMMTPLLQAAGYEVTIKATAVEALKLCETGEKFDVIVSDIEMPEMNGFEFAEKVKTSSEWQNIPMVALSSHATPEDMSRGKQVGFSDYVAKFDRERILTTISETLIKGEKG